MSVVYVVAATKESARAWALRRHVTLWIWPRSRADLPRPGTAHIYLAKDWTKHPRSHDLAEYFTESIGGELPPL